MCPSLFCPFDLFNAFETQNTAWSKTLKLCKALDYVWDNIDFPRVPKVFSLQIADLRLNYALFNIEICEDV